MSKNIKNIKNTEEVQEETKEERIARLKANEKRRAQQLAAKTQKSSASQKPAVKTPEGSTSKKPEVKAPEGSTSGKEAGKAPEGSTSKKPAVKASEGSTSKKPEVKAPKGSTSGKEEQKQKISAEEKQNSQERKISGEPAKKPQEKQVSKEPGKNKTVTPYNQKAREFEARKQANTIDLSALSGKGGKKVLLAVGGAAVVIYLAGAAFYSGHFFPQTSLNGVHVSGYSSKGAVKKMEKTAADYTLTVREKDGKEETIDGSSIDLAIESGDQVKEALKEQNGFAWPLKLFGKTKLDLDGVITCDSSKLKKVISGLSCMAADMQIMPVDAHVSDYDEAAGGFTIIEETEGTAVDEDAFLAAAETAVAHLDKVISLEDDGLYYEPAVTSEDETLQKNLELMNSLLNASITYQAGSKTEVLDASTYNSWLEVGEDGNVTLDEDSVSAYVDQLALKFNDYYSPKEFATSTGKTVTVTTSAYGWMIAKSEEAEAIKSDILSGQAVTREPNYKYKANSHDAACWGDTYVEVNITKQHVWFYKNGSLVIDTPCVTGNETKGNGTPEGIYTVDYCQRDATLQGENYSSAVSYWMPFNGNVGLHDASWRSKFGSTIYLYAGSHGCVNLPVDAAATIYSEIHQGYPVIVYKEE